VFVDTEDVNETMGFIDFTALVANDWMVGKLGAGVWLFRRACDIDAIRRN
jgi:hypothetical protein